MIEAWADWVDEPAPTALVRLAPEVAIGLDNLVATITQSVVTLTAVARQVCAETLSLTPLPDPKAGADEPPARGADEGFARAFAEQFSIDVSAVEESMRAELFRELGTRTKAFVFTLYVADWMPRLRRALEQLFAPARDGWAVPVRPTESDADLMELVESFSRSVALMDDLDPVTMELVRLREARQHNCRMCKSLRTGASLAAGADESTFDEIDDYADSSLSERHKAALALTDAMIWQPGYIDQKVIDDVRAHFTPAEAIELVLDLTRNATAKIGVACGTDQANVTEGVQIYDIEPDGSVDVSLAESPA